MCACIEILSNQLIRRFCVCGHRISILRQTYKKQRFIIAGNVIVLLEEERKDVERMHRTSPLLQVRRALPSSATCDLSPQFKDFTVALLVTSTAPISKGFFPDAHKLFRLKSGDASWRIGNENRLHSY